MKNINFADKSCVVYCDCCDTSTEVLTSDFRQIKTELEKQRWLPKYINRQHFDFCSKKCLKEFIE